MSNLSPTTLLLQDIISAPSKAETILETLTADQILMIEDTINRVKRRKMDKLPTPLASPTSVKKQDPIESVIESAKAANGNNASAAAAIANALAAAMVSAALQASSNTTVAPLKTVAPAATTTTVPMTSNDPVAEVKDGVEWVSFVYSHNRTLKRYSIRTDIQTVALDVVDDKFKAENCVRSFLLVLKSVAE
jgi:hypothetical protein